MFTFGRHIESKLNERHKDGKPKHKLAKLLGITKPVNTMDAGMAIQMLESMFGVPLAKKRPTAPHPPVPSP